MDTDRPALHYILHSADLIEQDLRRRLAGLDLHPRQARMIDALDRMGQASQIALAREFDVTPASMSTMAARLIAAGYVTRLADPTDHRGNLLRLTEHGESTLSAIRAVWCDVDRMIAARIGADNARTLADLARDLRDAMGGRVPGDPQDPSDTVKT